VSDSTETAILRMIKETDGEKYEDVRSLNQELTFNEASKEAANIKRN
jgi:ATP-dependent DNA helicase RecG